MYLLTSSTAIRSYISTGATSTINTTGVVDCLRQATAINWDSNIVDSHNKSTADNSRIEEWIQLSTSGTTVRSCISISTASAVSTAEAVNSYEKAIAANKDNRTIDNNNDKDKEDNNSVDAFK